MPESPKPTGHKHLAFHKKPDLFAIFLCFLFLAFWLTLLTVKFTFFGYYDWDLAMYAQAVWALSQGTLESSLFKTSFLTNHAEYIAFFLAPFYKLFPSAFTLIIFKILAFVSGSFVFYLITKKLLGWRLAMVFMILYQLHPANAFMMIYEFHFENLAIIFIFLMYYFFCEGRMTPFLISACFATIVKENISLVVLMFSVLAFFAKKEKRLPWILGPIILGGGFFLLTMLIITPHLRTVEGIAGANQYIGMYWNSSHPQSSFFQTITTNLAALWGSFISPVNLGYMQELFLPFHIMPFLSPFTLILGAPIFLQHFLSPEYTNHTLFYHYAATAVIFIFLATVESLARMKKSFKSLTFHLLLIVTITGFLLFQTKYIPLFKNRISDWPDRLDPIRQELLNKIPPNASIVSSFEYLDKLSSRRDLYSFHNVWRNHATFTNESPFNLPEVNYAMIDWRCPWLWQDLINDDKGLPRAYLKQINTFYFSRPWKTVYSVMDLTLLTTNDQLQGFPPLVQNSQTLFPEVKDSTPLFSTGENLHLLDLKVRPDQALSNLLPLTMIWQISKPTEDYLAIDFQIIKNNEVLMSVSHPIGYAFNATPLWTEGQYVKENYNLLLPDDSDKETILNLSIYNINKSHHETIFVNGQQLTSIDIKITK